MTSTIDRIFVECPKCNHISGIRPTMIPEAEMIVLTCPRGCGHTWEVPAKREVMSKAPASKVA